MAVITVWCERCGNEAKILPGQQMWHRRCPKKPLRGAIPEYLPSKPPRSPSKANQ